MLTVEIDDFDLFMLNHSLEFRKVVNGYLDTKTVDGDDPTDDVIVYRARTMQSFIDYMLRERGFSENASSSETAIKGRKDRYV